jgi:hypothetical protein
LPDTQATDDNDCYPLANPVRLIAMPDRQKWHRGIGPDYNAVHLHPSPLITNDQWPILCVDDS